MPRNSRERNEGKMIKNLLQNTTQLAQAIWAHYLSPQLASGAYAGCRCDLAARKRYGMAGGALRARLCF